MKAAYPIILTPAGIGYVVYVPDLRINTEGRDIADAIEMASDAICLWGIARQDMGQDIPPASADFTLLYHSWSECAGSLFCSNTVGSFTIE